MLQEAILILGLSQLLAEQGLLTERPQALAAKAESD
jgi:hypothetical protein